MNREQTRIDFDSAPAERLAVLRAQLSAISREALGVNVSACKWAQLRRVLEALVEAGRPTSADDLAAAIGVGWRTLKRVRAIATAVGFVELVPQHDDEGQRAPHLVRILPRAIAAAAAHHRGVGTRSGPGQDQVRTRSGPGQDQVRTTQGQSTQPPAGQQVETKSGRLARDFLRSNRIAGYRRASIEGPAAAGPISIDDDSRGRYEVDVAKAAERLPGSSPADRLFLLRARVLVDAGVYSEAAFWGAIERTVENVDRVRRPYGYLRRCLEQASGLTADAYASAIQRVEKPEPARPLL